ncbi:alkaline phosphatase family protein [Mesorhizobium caraganae]|uniref:alkaline phosphatase family protein n=1 Tax=Mesorhizobium caraganae TaxID=483206 RepID=UPI003ECE8546
MKKIIVLGFDGLEPSLLTRFWERGLCRNLARLRDSGGYRLLGTSTPAESPVAWSSFLTGLHPGEHGIFDFLHRDPETYFPNLSIAQTVSATRCLEFMHWRLPIGKDRVVGGRRGKPFWHAIAEAGFPVAIVRVPVTYPPEPFAGTLLASMGIPDLHGTQGAYYYWTTDPDVAGAGKGGDAVFLTFDGTKARAQLRPMADPFRVDGRPSSVDVLLEPQDSELAVSVGNESLRLKPGEWSDWIKVTYKFSLFAKVTGWVRLYLHSLHPHLNLYCSPVNVDPDAPAVPISHPPQYAAKLKRAIGSYGTLGMAEDTWVLNERRMDEEGFLASCQSILAERERMLDFELGRLHSGLLVCVFDQPDRMQHMFWRVEDEAHPAHEPAISARYRDVLEQLYERLDGILGRTIDAHPDAHILVMSDHGCKPFRRAIHVNRWLADNGFLAFDPTSSIDAASDYDLNAANFSQTRAYALGLSGIYLNLRGRESRGIVRAGTEAESVKREIASGLEALKDPKDGAAVITRVLLREDIFDGPATPDAPDLIVCYCEGYRASWQTALGAAPKEIFEDNLLAWSGDHCIDPALVPGVLLSNQPLTRGPLTLVDIAPSLHAYFGIPRDAGHTGRQIWADR